MKKTLLFLVFLNTLLLLRAQCPDFMDLYGPNVTCYFGNTSNPFITTGVVPGRHTLITQQGYDPLTGNNLPLIPPGESSVIRLGNEQTGAQAEAITYTFTVDPDQAVLLLKYAVVFQDPNHQPPEQPRFVVRVVNEEGELVDPCAEYNVYASERFPEFQTYVIPGEFLISNRIIRYLPWTNIGLDLSNYARQTVTVQFITYDCTQYGHFGYAYFTASCFDARNQLSLAGCDGDQVTLSAPDNFESYVWSNGATTQTTTFTIEENTQTVSCSITSATGCEFSLDGTLTSEGDIPSTSSTYYDTICEGDRYSQHFFNLPEQYNIGTFTFRNTFFNSSDCSGGDVTITLHLTIIPRITHIYDHICMGDEYHSHGFHITSLQEGTMMDTITTPHPNGCDELTILHLTVHSYPFYQHIHERACVGQNYNKHGIIHTNMQAGEIIDTIPQISTDEIACLKRILHIHVDNRPTSSTISGPTQICDYETNTYTYPIEDSTLTYNWSVPNGVQILNGQQSPSADIYFSENAPDLATISLSFTNGCGTQQTTLQISHNKAHYFFINDTLCSGNEYHKNGFDLSRQDSIGRFVYLSNHSSSSGCDSILILQLFVISSPTIYALAQPSDICEGGSTRIHAFAEIPDTIYKEPVNVGDIYCTDGSIVKPSEWPLSGKVAEGIVFHVNHSGYHGWIVHVGNQNVTAAWSTNNNIDISLLPNYSVPTALTDTNGYSNTQIIRNTGGATTYPAAWLVDFDNGWYLPAAGQLRILYSVLPTVNSSQQLACGTPFLTDYNFNLYLSSSENGMYVWALSETGTLFSTVKNTPNIIHSVRSF